MILRIKRERNKKLLLIHYLRLPIKKIKFLFYLSHELKNKEEEYKAFESFESGC
jgi:hypothetical protein